MYADLIGASSIVDLTWILSPVEYEELVEFYIVQLNNGADGFELDLILDDPLPEEYEVKFVPNTFQLVSQSGLTYTVNAQLEVLQKDIPEVLDEIFLSAYPNQESALLSLLADLVNVVMPEHMT